MDPETLEHEVIDIPDGMYPPSNSWYAWTPDAFVASSVQNCLYWKGGPNRWFTGTKIYKFDCDTREQTLFVDLEEEGANWKLYGCAIGVHPVTDDVYMALYHEFGTPTYITRRYSAKGEKIRDYEMIMNYWFPSLPLFAQGNSNTAVEEIDTESGISETGDVYTLAGTLVKTAVPYGDWTSLPGGILIWKSPTQSRKILIR